MNGIEWFKEAKYGLMLHFGLYSVLGGVYKGKRTEKQRGKEGVKWGFEDLHRNRIL